MVSRHSWQLARCSINRFAGLGQRAGGKQGQLFVLGMIGAVKWRHGPASANSTKLGQQTVGKAEPRGVGAIGRGGGWVIVDLPVPCAGSTGPPAAKTSANAVRSSGESPANNSSMHRPSGQSPSSARWPCTTDRQIAAFLPCRRVSVPEWMPNERASACCGRPSRTSIFNSSRSSTASASTAADNKGSNNCRHDGPLLDFVVDHQADRAVAAGRIDRR